MWPRTDLIDRLEIEHPLLQVPMGGESTPEMAIAVGNAGGLSLIPQIVDAVDLPVIAAGGISDGLGIDAALVLGASAVCGQRISVLSRGQYQ